MSVDLQGALGGSIAETLEGEVNGFIKQLGGKPKLLNLDVTENGTYTPPEGYDGYDEVSVDIEPTLDTLSVTENGTYTPPEGVDGYNEVVVDVPTPSPILQTLTVTANGTYTPPANVDGYNEIIVNVEPQPILEFLDDSYLEMTDTSITTNITLNSDYNYSYDFYMTDWRQDGAILGNTNGGGYIQWTPYNSYWYYSNGTSEYRDGSLGEYVGRHNISYNDYVVFDNNNISAYSRQTYSGIKIVIGYRANASTNYKSFFNRFKVINKNTEEVIADYRIARFKVGSYVVKEGIYDTVSETWIKEGTITSTPT